VDHEYRKHPIVVGFTKGATAAAAGAIVGAAAVIGTQVIVDVTTVVIFLAALVVLWRPSSRTSPRWGGGIIGLVIFAIR